MQYTKNLNLRKPDKTDYVQIEKLNENMDIIDNNLGKFKDTLTFTKTEKDTLEKIVTLSDCKTISDCNGAVSTGYYKGTNASNSPATGEFLLEVYKSDSGKIRQVYLNMTTNEVYTRKYSGTWGKWVKLTDEDDLKKAKEDIQSNITTYVHPSTHPASMITTSSSRRFVTDNEKEKWNKIPDLGNPEKIPASSNLNNYNTTGFYVCESGSDVQTLYNTPSGVTGGIFLSVKKSGTVVTQTLLDTNKVYIRKYNGSWRKWQEVAFKDDIKAKDIGLGNLINERQTTQTDLKNHIENTMPHIGTRANGTRYKWGFKSENGSLVYMEENL